jgi:hypothetical protein
VIETFAPESPGPLNVEIGQIDRVLTLVMLRSLIIVITCTYASFAMAKDDNINRHVNIHFTCRNQTVDIKTATDFYLNLSYKCRRDGFVEITPRK